MEPSKMALVNAFRKLNYNQPDLEAEFIVLTIDSIATAKLKGSLENEQEMLTFLKSKYQI